jgi:hypothetical protein
MSNDLDEPVSICGCGYKAMTWQEWEEHIDVHKQYQQSRLEDKQRSKP